MLFVKNISCWTLLCVLTASFSMNAQEAKSQPKVLMKKLAVVLVMGASLMLTQSAAFAQKSDTLNSPAAIHARRK